MADELGHCLLNPRGGNHCDAGKRWRWDRGTGMSKMVVASERWIKTSTSGLVALLDTFARYPWSSMPVHLASAGLLREANANCVQLRRCESLVAGAALVESERSFEARQNHRLGQRPLGIPAPPIRSRSARCPIPHGMDSSF